MNTESLASLYELARITGAQLTPGTSPEPVVSGLCAYFPTFKPGDLLVHRAGRPHGFLSNRAIALGLERGGSAILTEDPATLDAAAAGHPILHVKDAREAIIAIGRYARTRFQGKVIGVTGTAGKTSTVALITEALACHGESHGTAHSSNGPPGIAWTLSRPPSNAAFCTLEMSMQQMRKNSDLARPHIAVITNVGAGHLQGFHDVESVARQKALIFSAMSAGDCAIINADMAHRATFVDAANARGLNVVLYGQGADADVRMVHYENGRLQADAYGELLNFNLNARGHHFALNALAALAVLKVLQLDPNRSMQAIEQFSPANGRGEEVSMNHKGGQLTIRNDAYNANPLSMAASLETMAQVEAKAQNKVVVLGDMLELGPQASAMHQALHTHLSSLKADRLLLCGPLMRSLWETIQTQGLSHIRVCEWVETVAEAKKVLTGWLSADDYVLIKGSHGTQLHTLVAWLRQKETALQKGEDR